MIKDLLGKTLSKVVVSKDQDEVIFHSGEDSYKMYHCQDCCESVYIEDIVGDLDDLVGSPILVAEEVTNSGNPDGYPDIPAPEGRDLESYTWTFYKLATLKGYVDFRWLGESNGYYSESVDFVKQGSYEDY